MTTQGFDTVLVANRGEIAVRVIRTLREMGIRSVAVFSDADANARHVAEADVAVGIGPAPARQSYLNIDAVLDAARRTGAQAIHPGYGFLSENAEFAAALEAAGIVFIGPPVKAIQTMGDKIAAKTTVSAFGVPVVPGSPGLITADMVKAGSTVIDVGITRTEAGLVGDVDPGVAALAAFLTPVPGGVGPMTRAMLLASTVKAARYRRGLLPFP